MAIRQRRSYSDLIPSDIRDIRDDLRDKYKVELPEPGWYVGRINEQASGEAHPGEGDNE